jgi:hypothetical protein
VPYTYTPPASCTTVPVWDKRCYDVRVDEEKNAECWVTLFKETYCICGSKALWPYNTLSCMQDVYETRCEDYISGYSTSCTTYPTEIRYNTVCERVIKYN